MFDAQRFCDSYGIPYATSGKHMRDGWVNVTCPFCHGHGGEHGGFNVDSAYYNCWRCGSHWLPKVVAELALVSIPEAKDLVKTFTTGHASPTTKKHRNRPKYLTLPPDSGPMTKAHRRYLERRSFDPDLLIHQWGLMSTGHTGQYKFRILIPIHSNNRIVSYQCRDTTDTAPQKYLACHLEEEIIPHKSLVYGEHLLRGLDTCVVVEGVTDVWRLGIGAVCVFGIEFTPAQLLVLSKYKRVFILFDAEEQAQEQAEKLSSSLRAIRGSIETKLFDIDDGDPGELDQKEADQWMRSLGFSGF